MLTQFLVTEAYPPTHPYQLSKTSKTSVYMPNNSHSEHIHPTVSPVGNSDRPPTRFTRLRVHLYTQGSLLCLLLSSPHYFGSPPGESLKNRDRGPAIPSAIVTLDKILAKVICIFKDPLEFCSLKACVAFKAHLLALVRS